MCSNYYDLGKYAKEITWNDVEKNWPGGKISDDKVDGVQEWFKKIAGRDMIIQAPELEIFFNDLKSYSENYANGKRMMTYRGKYSIAHLKNFITVFNNREGMGILSNIFGDHKAGELFLLIEELIDINKDKVQDDAANVPKDRYFENNQLKKEIIKNDDKTTTEQLYDEKGNVVRKTIKDANGNIIDDKSFGKNNEITEHTKPENLEIQFEKVLEKRVTKDASGNKIKDAYTFEDGKIVEYIYKDGIKIQENNISKDGTKQVSDLDENGEVKSYTFYDSNGQISSKTIHNKDGSERFNHYNDNGKLSGYTVTYRNPDNPEIYKEKVFDGNGKLLHTKNVTVRGNRKYEDVKNDVGSTYITTYKMDDTPIKTVEKDKTGKLLSKTTYDSKGNLKTITRYHNDEILEESYTNGNRSKITKKDLNGELITTTEETHNKKGERTNIVIKDASGNILETENTVYDNNGRVVKQRTNKNGDVRVTTYSYSKTKHSSTTSWVETDDKGAVIETVEITRNNNGTEYLIAKDSNGNITKHRKFSKENGQYQVENLLKTERDPIGEL